METSVVADVKCIKEWWKVKKTTATAALARTGDSDPF